MATNGLTRFDVLRFQEYLQMEIPFWRILYSLMLHTGCRRSTLKYPDDTELRESLRKLDLYQKKRLCDVVFTSIEYYNKDQPYLLNEINVKGSRSIEHIMPQKMSNEWEDYFGDEAEEFHEK